jgi:hypothetical protein
MKVHEVQTDYVYNIYVNAIAAFHYREKVIAALEIVSGVEHVEYRGGGGFYVLANQPVKAQLLAAVKGI